MSVFPPSLWEFSVSVYAQPEMERLCLWLQDHRQVNVNTLLWALWLDEQQIAFDADHWQRGLSRAAVWQRWWVIPLRSLRRRLPKRRPWLGVRARVQQWELNGERRQLHSLQAVSDGLDFTRDGSDKGIAGSGNDSGGQTARSAQASNRAQAYNSAQTSSAGYAEQLIEAGDTFERLQQIMSRWRQQRGELSR